MAATEAEEARKTASPAAVAPAGAELLQVPEADAREVVPGGEQCSDSVLLRKFATVALPAYPMALVARLVSLCTAALVGQMGSEHELAAIGLCAVVTNITGYTWLWGLSSAISTLSSQAWGARQFRVVGVTMQRAFWVLLLFADVPLALIWLTSERWLTAAGQDPEVARYVGIYCRIRAPGLLMESISTVLNKTLSSMSNVQIPLLVSVMTMGVNLLLCFLLIPQLGFIGAPLAVVASDIVQASGLLLLSAYNADMRKCWTGFTLEAFRDWGPFLRISIPSMALLGIEWWTFDAQNLISGWISPLAQATQSVAPQICDVQYCVGQAANTGATTVIGNLLGEGKALAARRAAWLFTLAVTAAMVVQVTLFAVLKDVTPRVFSNDPAVIASVSALMPTTLAFSFFDGIQTALCGILVAVARQHIAAPLIFGCYWVFGLPFGCFLAFHQKQGINGLWTGMLLAVLLHVMLFGITVLRLRWHKVAKEVQDRLAIESAQLEQDDRHAMSVSLQHAAA